MRAKVHVMWLGAVACVVIAFFSGFAFYQGRKGDAVLIGSFALAWLYIAVMAKIRLAKARKIDPAPVTRL
jgi:hypothetical protein